MRDLLAGALVVASVSGCSRAGEKERIGAAQTVDTTIITSDTTARDTSEKKGEGKVRLDTTRYQ